MSKGTKQIRLGKVERFVKELEQRLEVLNEIKFSGDYYRVEELDLIIRKIKKEFELESGE